ncbi:sugar transferase [Loktanella sp. DJP18]|uniref:sugar transferase n=1 Tax=Loktanella sp. DJP18 TaxID=3409788 RepID=UPI003BB59240
MATHFRNLSSEEASAEVDGRLVLVSTIVVRRPYLSFAKRVIDIVAIMLSSPFVVPLVLLLALCVVLDGGKPFFTQDRLGRNGRVYRIWKLRTMVSDAEARLQGYLDHNPDAKTEWDSLQKLKCDPRITTFGRLLRKSSLDELPQLWNVLIGDMSLVGPRPMMCDQRVMYPGTAYFDLRPGITGYWQISARNEGTFSERAYFDTLYAHDVSLLTDLRILVATVRVVIRGTGY